jgi:hypothetical protein
VSATGADGGRIGRILYALQPGAAPLGITSSWLCLSGAKQGLGVQRTTGTAGQCDGSLAVDANSFWAGQPGALGQPIHPGQTLYFQAWAREPITISTSDGLGVFVCP